MPETIRLLLVEDNVDEQEEWQRTIRRQNVQAGDKAATVYELTIAPTLQVARSEIESREFDAAIVDLRLASPGEDSMDRSGNDIIELLLKSELAAIAMFTGEPTGAVVPGYAKAQVKVFTKGGGEGEGTEAVLKWLIAESPMITCVRNAQKEIKQEMARFFVRSVWPRWSNWLDDPEAANKEFLATAMARHITSHVYASLLDKFNQRAHSEEWYVVPPIHSSLRTGDIVRRGDGVLEIVVTPRCDLATGKRKAIQLAEIEDVSADWNRLNDAMGKASAEIIGLQQGNHAVPDSVQKKFDQAKNKQHAFTQHRSTNSLHFLPQMKLSAVERVGPFMIRFDLIRSISPDGDEAKKLVEATTRIASVASEFLPSMVERLGTFFSRIGTPDYSHF